MMYYYNSEDYYYVIDEKRIKWQYPKYLREASNEISLDVFEEFKNRQYSEGIALKASIISKNVLLMTGRQDNIKFNFNIDNKKYPIYLIKSARFVLGVYFRDYALYKYLVENNYSNIFIGFVMAITYTMYQKYEPLKIKEAKKRVKWIVKKQN